MSYSLKIKPKGALFRTRLDAAALRKQFGRAYHIGGVGDFGSYMAEPAPPDDTGTQLFMVYAAREQLGRGFYLSVDKNGVCELITPLPTTGHDLEDLFTFAGVLARVLGAGEVEATGGHKVSYASLLALYSELMEHNAELLKSQAITQAEPLVVSTIKLPLTLPQKLCGRISMLPPEHGLTFFSSYLAEKQQMEFTYLRPYPAEGPEGAGTGVYVVGEDEPLVLPVTPFIPPGPSPFGGVVPTRWEVRLVPRTVNMLGSLPYADFYSFLEEHELLRDYDDHHRLIHGLHLRRMKAMLEK